MTDTKAIVLQNFWKGEIGPENIKAMDMLLTGIVPPSEISTHPGKGQKTFAYIKHTYATSVLNDAFGMLWDFEIKSYEVFPDTSALAIVATVFHIPMGDNLFYTRRIEETGNFQPINGGMNSAASVSSAVSRGLLKCLFRGFGFGKQLYDDKEDIPTPKGAYNVLLQTAKRLKVFNTGLEMIAYFKTCGLLPADFNPQMEYLFVDNFGEMYEAIGSAKQDKSFEPIPEAIPSEPAPAPEPVAQAQKGK